MPDIINLLPDAIANQIAAGEVIQRPASAVKELMENAIDAGGTEIKLLVKDAGKTLIQVIDNGCGMSETDARMCFERHATSKIRTIDDLFAIRTMGFRGEAMASIAAVAQVELQTKRVEDELGTVIHIEDSKVLKQEPCQCADGTSISIKNLFYNVPARRNFLKSPPAETRHIIDEFQRIALSYPHISFSLYHNGIEIFHLNAGNMRQRIVAIFGSNYNERLVPVEEKTDALNITGFIAKPEFAKRTRGEQFFFVNNRFIKNAYLNHAVMSAYEDIMPANSFPLYVLGIDINPARIDINVHPTKQEIKFDDEKLVYSILNAVIRRSLGKYSITPTLDFEQEQFMNTLPTYSQQKYEAAPAHRDFPSSGNYAPNDHLERSNRQNWEQLYEKRNAETHIPSPADIPANEKHLDSLLAEQEKNPYQLHNRYIITPIKSGLVIIDQQAAHERVIYERLTKALETNQLLSQQQLFPQKVELTPTDAVLFSEILPAVNSLGFDIREFGNNTFLVHGVPADLPGGNESHIIENLLEQYKNSLNEPKLDKRNILAKAIARSTAIPAGQTLSVREMKTLTDELFACEIPYKAPNGKLTFITFGLEEIEKLLDKGR